MSRASNLSPTTSSSESAGASARGSFSEGGQLPAPAFHDPRHHIKIFHGDCLQILAAIPAASIDLIFADPPYFLSNGGITCHAGRMVSVNKGDWDRSRGADANHEFNTAWLAACRRVLKPDASIWVSGTSHVIHSVGFAMQQLGFKLLNDISWVKPNPPPNLLPLFHPRHRNHHLGRARQKVPPQIQLQTHAPNRRRQTDEIRLDHPPS